jgi:type II secretory pathway component PulM
MKHFAQQSGATQKLVVGLVAAALLIGGSALSWTMHHRVAAAQSRLDASRANLQAMTDLVQRFQAREGSGAATDLSAVVTRSLQGKSFQPALMQQQNGELALRFDSVPFDELLGWMLELEEAGAVATNVAVAQAQSGGVTLTLVLRGA